MKIYTRKGDDGRTSLMGGGRVSKSHARVAAYGTVDELNSVLGWGITQVADPETRARLIEIQHDLFALGASLATVAPEGRGPRVPDVPLARVEQMERWVDEADDELPALTAFILPGGSPGAAALHVARAVCRRAERGVASLKGAGEAKEGRAEAGTLTYLNRLSDLLFTLARLENARAGVEDVRWRGQ